MNTPTPRSRRIWRMAPTSMIARWILTCLSVLVSFACQTGPEKTAFSDRVLGKDEKTALQGIQYSWSVQALDGNQNTKVEDGLKERLDDLLRGRALLTEASTGPATQSAAGKRLLFIAKYEVKQGPTRVDLELRMKLLDTSKPGELGLVYEDQARASPEGKTSKGPKGEISAAEDAAFKAMVDALEREDLLGKLASFLSHPDPIPLINPDKRPEVVFSFYTQLGAEESVVARSAIIAELEENYARVIPLVDQADIANHIGARVYTYGNPFGKSVDPVKDGSWANLWLVFHLGKDAANRTTMRLEVRDCLFCDESKRDEWTTRPLIWADSEFVPPERDGVRNTAKQLIANAHEAPAMKEYALAAAEAWPAKGVWFENGRHSSSVFEAALSRITSQ